MIQTLTRQINGANYTVTQFTARRALRIQAKLIKALGPFLFEISVNPGKAVELLASTISDDTFEILVTEILTCSRKEGMELTPATIDMEFAGDLGTLYEVVKFALEVNFENFWKALGIGKKEENPTLEPSTKTVFTKR